MPNATDLITYIGVPLTVLGILPILLNIAKALWIWYRLLQSLPRLLRPFYHLIIDPANGNVTVVARPLVCDHSGLWKKVSVDTPLSFGRLEAFRHWCRRKYAALLHGQDVFEDIELQVIEDQPYELPLFPPSRSKKVSIKPRAIRLRSGKLLRLPWMDVASAIGFGLERTTHPEAMRFIVNSSLETKKPLPLPMKWSDFIWFSLAIGVNAMDSALISNMRTPELPMMNVRRDATMMMLSKCDHDLHANLNPDDTILELICSIRRALAWFEVMCFELGGQTYCRRLGNDTMPLSEPFLRHFKHEPQTFTDQLSAAATWISYNRLHLKSLEDMNASKNQHLENTPRDTREQGALFVSQRLLEIQERSLCFLQELDKHGRPNGHLLSLFYGHDVKAPDGQTFPGFVLANAFLVQLRSLFESSTYVRTSHAISGTLRKLAISVRSRDMDDTVTFFTRDFSMLFKTLKQKRSPDDSEMAKLVLYVMRNCREYELTLESFDPIHSMDASKLRGSGNGNTDGSNIAEITYIGVPLTVMGIMPILWNFLKAFLIRFRLSQTVPWELRPFYTLSADAANGDVTVVIDSVSCVHPGLWPDEKAGVQCTLTPGMMFKRWSHRVFYRLIYKCEPVYTKIYSMWNNFMFRWFPSIQEDMYAIDTDAGNQVGELANENQSLPTVWTWSAN
ncbi:hypothetical protein BKA80DRAFT_312969 [Phyllosticta citrichinensis]